MAQQEMLYNIDLRLDRETHASGGRPPCSRGGNLAMLFAGVRGSTALAESYMVN
jgi:hypothetical protein